MSKNSEFEKFTKKYQVNKTLRFALISQENTQKYITDRSILEHDIERDQAYKSVKKLMDDYYKAFIDECLDDIELDWVALADAIKKFRKKELGQDKLKLEQEKARNEISARFKKMPEFKKIFKKEFINELLPEFCKTQGVEEEKSEQIKLFSKFVVYFDGYFKVREDMFGAEEKSNVISYRIVNENFPVYLNNISMFQEVKEKYSFLYDIVANNIKAEIKKMPDLDDWQEYFSVEGYNRVLTQKAIDKYNYIIGILNKESNLYQQNNKQKNKIVFARIHKQMLSERESFSFIPEQFKSDDEVIDALQYFMTQMNENKILNRISNLYEKTNFNSSGIFIAPDMLTDVSQKVYGDWNYLERALREKLLDGVTKITKKKTEEVERIIIKQAHSISELSECAEEYEKKRENETDNDISKLFDDVPNIVEEIRNSEKQYIEQLTKRKKSLLEDKETTSNIKQYLDACQVLLHFLKMFNVDSTLPKYYAFYEEADDIYSRLQELIPLYNKVRNYVTQKPYKTEKYKLNFERSDFLHGWSKEYGSKEAIIFKKGELFYLGIIEKKLSQKDIDKLSEDIEPENQGIRYVYDFQKPDNKNIPRLFIRSKGEKYAPAVEKYHLPINDIIDIYDNGKFKTEYRKINEEEYKDALVKMIDYFKLGFTKHESFKQYHFIWKESDQYENIAEFYKDVENSCYMLSEENINFNVVREYAQEGKIYLFQIYNKDFAVGSTGTPNLHTLYWKSLFSKENLDKTIIKLNGQAEIFRREASITEPISHKKGEKLVNRWDKEKEPIPDAIYQEIYQYENGKISEISKKAKQYIDSNKVNIKEVTHEIIKDRRYTRPQYLLHVPVTINFMEPEQPYKFNTMVRATLKNNPNVNIIGIDRGERNLIYVSLINQRGEILEQKRFNIIQTAHGDVKYHAKLQQREEERNNARRSWKTIGNIKELKEGYLSQVIHEIVQMMIDNNAIIVMEDLNRGFKRGRMKVEKQVYQKFEKMLIEKLNYLSFKTTKDGQQKNALECGGVLNGYQLSDKFVSFQKLGRQNGFIFYVPASYTSKIDPATGFVDIFCKLQNTHVDDMRKFLSKFDKIYWDKSLENFVFCFNYDNFDTTQTSYIKEWTVTSCGKRILWSKSQGYYEREPKIELQKLFTKNDISYSDERNLVNDIATMDNTVIKGIYEIFRIILLIRNSRAIDSDDPQDMRNSDYIYSPAIADGRQFDSRENYEDCKRTFPIDADANGAYHIALKGLMYLRKISDKALNDGTMDEKELNITVQEWLRFVQNKEYLK